MGTLIGIVAAVLLLACLLLAGGGCSSKTPSAPPPIVTTAGMKSLDRTAVRALLEKLADTDPPIKKHSNAMCYSPAMPPLQASYVCPNCGERTLYDDSKKNKEPFERGDAATVQWEIPSCRRAFQELREVAGDAILLDESQFCRKCSPKVTEPKLVLRVAYADRQSPNIVSGVTDDDLRILHHFLAGELYGSGFDDEIPLKESLPRLQELLGVKLDD
jgi:hypothetical protein